MWRATRHADHVLGIRQRLEPESPVRAAGPTVNAERGRPALTAGHVREVRAHEVEAQADPHRLDVGLLHRPVAIELLELPRLQGTAPRPAAAAAATPDGGPLAGREVVGEGREEVLGPSGPLGALGGVHHLPQPASQPARPPPPPTPFSAVEFFGC
jgi:hypothetical protein